MEAWINRITGSWNIQSVLTRLEWSIPYCAALASILLLEILLNGWNKSSLGILSKRARTHVFDGFAFLLFVFGFHRIISDLFFLGFFSYVSSLTIQTPLMKQWELQWPLALQFLVGFIAKDFLLYWAHRGKHTIGVLWKVHEFHHSSTQLTWFTSFRVHPLDLIVGSAFVYFPLQAFFGWSILDSFLFSVVTSVMGKLTHSRLDWDFGWVGKWILVSPRAHHLHHAIDARNGRNFSDSLILWDRLFGTYVAPTISIHSIPQGIPENFYESEPLLLAFVRPVKDFYLRLVQIKYWKIPS